MATIYGIREYAIQREIVEALGECADQHDIEAIADEVLEYHQHIDDNGNIRVDLSGVRLRPEMTREGGEHHVTNFWGVVMNHAHDSEGAE